MNRSTHSRSEPVRSYRATTIFGSPDDLIAQIAEGKEIHYWLSDRSINLVGPGNSPTTPSLTYGPPPPPASTATLAADYTPTVIGTPQQTENGVAIRVLLDGRCRVGMLIKLDQSVIRQIPQYPGQQTLTVLNKDGTYYVAGVRHIGDSRGDPWYTEITGVTPMAWETWFHSKQVNPS